MKRFLGRTLNTNTLMWEFPDGSGVPIPDELRSQLEIDAYMSNAPFPHNMGFGAQFLGRLFKYKDEHSIKSSQ